MSKRKTKSNRDQPPTTQASQPALVPGQSRPTSAEGRESFGAWKHLLCSIWLASITFAAYSNCYQGIAIFDDDTFIRNSSDFRETFPPNLLAPAISRPFVRWTLWWNNRISGYDLWSYHLVNVLVHLIAAFMLFEIVRRLCSLKLPSTFRPQAIWSWLLPVGIASVWTVHPLNTQAVTYVIQRCESMMGMFFLLTLFCLIASVQSTRRQNLWLVIGIVCAYLGMGCKQVMVAICGVAFLLDYVFLEASVRKIFRERWWFYVGLTAVGIYGLYDALLPLVKTVSPAQVAQVGPSDAPQADRSLLEKDATISAGFHFKGFTKWEYLRTQFEVIPFYVRLAIWPDPLCLDYRWLVADNPLVYLSYGGLLAVIFGLGSCLAFRRSPIGFLILSFFFILAPTSSIMPINDMALEHRMYLPLICVVSLLSVGAVPLSRLTTPRCPDLSFAMVVIAWTIVLGYLTYQRNFDYHSEINLWKSVVEARPNNDRGWRNLGHYYNVAQRPEDSLASYQTALDLMNRTIPKPSEGEFADVMRNIGNAYKDLQKYDEAFRFIRESERLNPKDPITQQSLGRLYAITGKLEEAKVYFQTAEQLDPNDAEIQRDLGGLKMFLKNYEEAIAHFQRAIELQPRRVDLGKTLAGAYADLGQFQNALKECDKLLAWLPKSSPEEREIRDLRNRISQTILQLQIQQQQQQKQP